MKHESDGAELNFSYSGVVYKAININRAANKSLVFVVIFRIKVSVFGCRRSKMLISGLINSMSPLRPKKHMFS